MRELSVMECAVLLEISSDRKASMIKYHPPAHLTAQQLCSRLPYAASVLEPFLWKLLPQCYELYHSMRRQFSTANLVTASIRRKLWNNAWRTVVKSLLCRTDDDTGWLQLCILSVSSQDRKSCNIIKCKPSVERYHRNVLFHHGEAAETVASRLATHHTDAAWVEVYVLV
nr:hypothetical protein CFP56_32450 [Quercus suber]